MVISSESKVLDWALPRLPRPRIWSRDVKWPRVGVSHPDKRPRPPEWHGTWGGLSGRERTALKQEASRSNGTKFGRPRKIVDGEHIATAKRMKADGHTGKDIAKYLGVSRANLYRYLATTDRRAGR